MAEKQLSTSRQIFAVGAIVTVLVLAGVANATIKRHRSAEQASPNAAQSVVAVSSHMSSTAWYCPGPLPIGRRGEVASIAVTNASSNVVSGQIRVTSTVGQLMAESISVPPTHQAVIAIPRPRQATYAAVTVLLDGSGVGVEELDHGPNGAISSPCVTHTATTQYFATGSTLGAANATLALYDPGATPAVANVTLSLGATSTAPPAFQGVPVEPGQLVVLFLGHYVPQKQVVAAEVTTDGGRIVAGELNASVVTKVLVDSLVAGAAVTQPAWWFTAQVAGPSTDTAYSIFNPSNGVVQARLTLFGTGGEVAATVVVPPLGVVRVNPAAAEPIGALRFASVTTSNRAGVVAEREATVVTAFNTSTLPGATTAPTKSAAKRSSAIGAPAIIDPGYAVSAGLASYGRTWLLAGGESNARTSEMVTIANPGSHGVVVTLRQFYGSSSVAIPGVGPITVPGGAAVAVDIGRFLTARPSIAIVAQSTAPALVEATLYGHGANRPIGFTAPAPLAVE